MNVYIRNPLRPHRPAHSSHVLEMLGLKSGSHIPPEWSGREFTLDGIKVRVAPPGVCEPRARRSSKHRLIATCPVCSREVSVGRIFQHAKVHESFWTTQQV